MIWYDVSFSPACLIFSQLLNWEAISLHVQIEFYIVFKTENIDFMSRTSLFSEQRYVNNGMGYIYNIAIAIAMEVYDIHTSTDTGNTGNGGFTIYFILFYLIWFSNGIEVPVTVESIGVSNCCVQHEHWAASACTIKMWNAFHVLVKCVFVWSFLFNFETIKA